MWKPDYAQVHEFRDWLRVRNIEQTLDDDVYRLNLSVASRALDTSAGRQFGKVDELTTFTYEVRWSRYWQEYYAEIDDLMDLTSLAFTLDGTLLTADQYKLYPRNAVAKGKAYTYARFQNVSVTDGELDGAAWWGWNPSARPPAAKLATMLQASRLDIRRDSPYGVAGGNDGNNELRLLERLDPDILPMIKGYIRTGWVAR